MPDAEESSSGDGSSSEDSDEEVELDPQQLDKLMKIEGELETAPDYSKMIEYIGLLRQAKLRARLRSAYERMASLFPMTEQLWLDWVNDELEQVRSEEDIDRIQHIFQQATQDYLSTNIWSQYLGFVAELDPAVRGRTPAGVGKMRELCEAALTAAGLHAEFELGLLESGGQGQEKQADKVRSTFQRQLQIPLADHKETLEAYKAWEAHQGKSVPPHVMKAAEKAAEAFTLRLPYEQAVSADKPADAALLAAYLSYIKLEQAQKDPARVQVVYERAVTCFPVTAELWAQYTKYLEHNLKVPSVVNAVYTRATRNCYWVGSLWACVCVCVDRFGAPKQGVCVCVWAALSSGMQTVEDYMDVLLAHLDALRHRTASPSSTSADSASASNSSAAGTVAPEELRAAFAEAAASLAAYWPSYQDRLLRLPSYQAHCEVHVLKDLAAARKVWEDTLKSGLGRYYEAWLAYANMERGLRNLKEARNVFKRAYSRRLEEGGQPLVCAEWLRFEREEGSADDLFHASIKVDPVMEEAAAAAAAAAADQQAAAAAKVRQC
ncbi:hypothetical protein DUNSADRAFT_17991 [Dunaliella salina]|uniref:Suppressor of forked domain-containing protein n=1 Tax=Dunaliella salina TaxID=3046 RepID=A0ABQ7G0V8_DUNSA|nr:hypothetical protein DUNSADRAFT_17991 [Dunaliella salina]|eukprot:KAF5828241.1 hypothetical protein DUNSADRAFT_17991 [Dunaliella salina]